MDEASVADGTMRVDRASLHAQHSVEEHLASGIVKGHKVRRPEEAAVNGALVNLAVLLINVIAKFAVKRKVQTDELD